MNEFQKQILKDSPTHGSIPFWSWNDRLGDEELCRQIQNMKALGMRGFFMHARGGLETEYMSPAWFHAVDTCVREAERLGMEAWAYDENGWPSGFAGGELLKAPENQACELLCGSAEEFPAPSPDLIGVYRIENNRITRLSAPDGRGDYTVVRFRRDFSYVDTMNADITRRFLELTHERYRKELSPDVYGSVMPGFFTDEPQYFRYGTPWSPVLQARFPERFGYDVTDHLPALFYDVEGAEELRYDYHLMCHELFYNGFMKPVYEWCEAHGIKLTGHAIEEWGLGGQMMCCGGVMPFYLYEHIPGIDYLGRAVKNISGAKQLGSVCAQSGKRVALSEMFACCGWDVTPRELKRIAELQFAGGVNLICEHLYAYSERGQRKRDFPNHYSDHNPWSRDFAAFEQHFQHLGAALSQGEEIADTLVLHPIRTAYLHYKHTVHSVGTAVCTNASSGIAQAEADFEELVNKLSEWQIPYHFGDETVNRLLGARVEGNCIRVGNCLYRRVLLPHCETLESGTVALLREFLAAGGELLIEGAAPTRIDGKRADLSFLQSNLTWEALRADCGITVKSDRQDRLPLQLQMRQTQWGRVIFLVNTGEMDCGDVYVTLPSCKGLIEIDLQTLAEKPLQGRQNADGSVTVKRSFAEFASCLMLEGDAPMLPMKQEQAAAYRALPKDFTLAELPENMMLLEDASLSFDGGLTYTEPRPIARIRDNLLKSRYAGELHLRFSFESRFCPSQLCLVCEPIKGMKVTVNGKACTPIQGEWRLDRSFLVYDVAKNVKCGENTVELVLDYHQREEVYRVLYGGGNEALRNCLCFDTEVEAVYLYGHFCVRALTPLVERERGILYGNGPFALEEQTDRLDLRCINTSGYPFFAGDLTADAELIYTEGEPTRIRLGGRFATCGAEINGRDLGTQLFTDEFELAPYLKEGKNTLRLRLCFSNRNLLGPHHTLQGEPTFVTPRTFSFERAWEEACCPAYRPDFSFIRFGIGFGEPESKLSKQ